MINKSFVLSTEMFIRKPIFLFLFSFFFVVNCNTEILNFLSGSWNWISTTLQTFVGYSDVGLSDLSKVNNITYDNWKTTLSNSSSEHLILLHVNWCPYSRALLPVFIEVNKRKPSNVSVSFVDANIYPGLAALFDVVGYPTIKYLRFGKVYTIRNIGLSADYVLNYLSNQTWNSTQSFPKSMPSEWSFSAALQIQFYNFLVTKSVRYS
jgi:thiol-disulfide isomerase/thioredoxin